MDYSREAALRTARHYIAIKLDRYEYDRYKFDAKTWLLIGNLEAAIYHTQVALFILRLRRVS